MSEVSFAVLDVAPEPYAAAPILAARVAVSADAPVHAIALRCQVRIEPHRRRYTDAEAAGLVDLFGGRERWSSTQHSFVWLQCAALVQGFAETCEATLPMPCTYDFEVAASKYLHALEEGTVPLVFLFSGTLFTKGAGGFGVQQIPWDREDRYDLPVSVWRDLIRMHFPNTGWVRLGRETLEALAEYKSTRGLVGLDEAVTELLAQTREQAR
ncbi:DUF6084 family protein [Rhodococcus maanshanensis]|uniref:DUF6084 family protein n=1 Tax=Rhodococcus maanshanensis TaxID=183556 RepID=UPI0022B3138A|nr:DUF6084 family protein [Rhodococcus maanshanensis]MCZ4558791.1 DUF6084 family protein [Rhodococcus maanshanensis]